MLQDNSGAAVSEAKDVMGLRTHDLGVRDTPCLFAEGSKTHSTGLLDTPMNLVTNAVTSGTPGYNCLQKDESLLVECLDQVAHRY